MGLFSALMGNAGVVGQDDLIRDYGKLLTEGESIDLGFKLIRDTFIFTNKRMMIMVYKKQNRNQEGKYYPGSFCSDGQTRLIWIEKINPHRLN